MSKSKSKTKPKRNRYTDEYKQEALRLAERLGVAKATSQLGHAESQLYNWRAKARNQMSRGDREQHQAVEQAVEIARLKRQLVEREEENAILKNSLCASAAHRIETPHPVHFYTVRTMAVSLLVM